MSAIAKKLDARLSRWAPEKTKKVEKLVAEFIELADPDALDVLRSRRGEQEVLDIVDGRKAGLMVPQDEQDKVAVGKLGGKLYGGNCKIPWHRPTEYR